MFNILKFLLNHPLNKKKFSSIKRFFRWQISSRVLNQPMIVPFVDETRLIIKRGQTTATGSFYLGLVEFQEMSFAYHYCKNKDLSFDIGANIGVYSVLLGTKCKVVALEPIPKTYESLVDNINLNRMNESVKTLNLGVGDKEDELRFTMNQDAVNHVATKEDRDEVCVVKTKSLDQLVEEYGLPDFIKIDVEGFESNVVKGGRKTFSRDDGPNAILIELRGHGSRYGFDEEKIHQFFISFGYLPYTYVPQKREVQSWSRPNDGKLGDLIYIKDLKKAAARVKQSRPIRILNQRV